MSEEPLRHGANHTAAKYIDPIVEHQRNNPAIEALPPPLGRDAVAKILAYRPTVHEATRDLPEELRRQYIENLERLFINLDIHERIALRFDTVIRASYVSRNPLFDGHYWRNVEDQAAILADLESELSDNVQLTAPGMMILGGSGNGKSALLKRLIDHYPSVIEHREYHKRPFILNQIPCLYLEAPLGCSLNELILTLFTKIDDLVGTNYRWLYGRDGHRSVPAMIPFLPNVIRAHAIGAIVFDELQNIDTRKSRDELLDEEPQIVRDIKRAAKKKPDFTTGEHKKMLNFLVKLTNVASLPIVTIGTFQTSDLLCSEFRLLRRLIAGGSFLWDRLNYDAIWEHFVKALWEFQYLKRAAPYEKTLGAILYDRTQGIIGYAVRVFQEAQRLAIEKRKEAITRNILIEAANTSLADVEAVMYALKIGDPQLVPGMRDVFPRNLQAMIRAGKTCYWNGRLQNLNGASCPSFNKPPAELLVEKTSVKSESSVPAPEPASASDGAAPSSSPETTPSKKSNSKSRKARTPAMKNRVLPAGGLLDVSRKGKLAGLSAYEALKAANFLQDTSAYLAGNDSLLSNAKAG